MRKDRCEEADRGREGNPGTPARELERIRLDASGRDALLREAIEEAALEVSGQVGYRKLTVQRVLERSGTSRNRFYRNFASKADCYAAAYGVAIERLGEELLGAARGAADWRDCFRRTLEELGRFLEEQPLQAKGLLAEVHVAGGPAMAKRKEVFERLARAVDSARRETESRHSPPPITAAFMVSAIEESVVRALILGETEQFAATIPDLVQLAVSAYFGDEGADRGAM